MSVKVMSWVFEHSQTTENHRLVALALADAAHDDGRCWPGIERVASKARCSTRTVMRATAHMVALGELVITDRGNRTNSYQFTLGCSDKLSPHDAAREVTPEVSVVTPEVICSDTGVTQSVRNRKKNRKSRFVPDDETLTPERLTIAYELGLTKQAAEREWAKFADHEFPAGRSDWTRAWRNWCRGAAERAKPNGQTTLAPKSGGSLEYRIRMGL